MEMPEEERVGLPREEGRMITIAAWGAAAVLIVALAGALAIGAHGLSGMGTRFGDGVGGRFQNALSGALSAMSVRAPEPGDAATAPGKVYPIHGGVDMTRVLDEADSAERVNVAVDGGGVGEGADPVVITYPSWIVRPVGEYPREAMRSGVETGSASMMCRVRTDGRIGACGVTEDPPGYGFGQTALASAHDARLAPRMVDGIPVESNVRFTIRYQVE